MRCPTHYNKQLKKSKSLDIFAVFNSFYLWLTVYILISYNIPYTQHRLLHLSCNNYLDSCLGQAVIYTC